ncbi:MAG: glycosyltransferase family 2 protein [Cyclobacteriaceae bacterium]
MEWLVIIGYISSLTMVAIFSLEQLNLSIKYLKGKKVIQPEYDHVLKSFPLVTIQLPIFNEKYVAARLIDSVCLLNYPKNKLEIQVLDDSTDETSTILSSKISEWRAKGIDIKHIQRESRIGYKAGALQHGTTLASGEYIAIFDADFMPHADFLSFTLPHFHEGIGMIQTRWSHLNQDYSLLTRMQAFGLNAHFTVEQKGRECSGKFMNFNGTGGIWKKACIEDAGGWQHDTLTEDLDLSYRAQLNGWKFKYLEDVLSPAELPVLVPAIKSQQYRWNKGAAETARKNVVKILMSKIGSRVKLHALLHLFNSSVFLFLLIAAVLSVPMLYIKEARPDLLLLFDLASVFLIGFIAMTIFYWIAAKKTNPKQTFKYFAKNFPVYISFSMGLALHNSIAVVEGFVGKKTPFIRTPKFNIQNKGDSWKGNVYLKQAFAPITIIEALLCLYFIFGIFSGFYLKDYGLILFHIMLALGYGGIFIFTIRPITNAG